MQNEHSPHFKLRPHASSHYIQSGAYKSADICVATMYRLTLKSSLKKTRLWSQLPFHMLLSRINHFFLNTFPKHTLEGTLRQSENKPFDLLYKHNSISHTSVWVCVCVTPSKLLYFQWRKEGHVCGQCKADKGVGGENHWVLCSSHFAPTERSLTAAELFHVLSVAPSLPPSLWLCLPPLSPPHHLPHLPLSLVVMDNWVTWSSLCWPAGPLPSTDWASLPPSPPRPAVERQSSL